MHSKAILMSRQRLILICLMASLAGVALYASAVRAVEPPSGAKLAAERCATCHGVDGRGVSPEYPSLAAQHGEYIVKQIFNFKTGQRVSPHMEPVVSALMSGEIRALAAHFSGLPAARSQGLDPTLRAEGERLYQRGNAGSGVAACASCHGESAAGGAQLPRLAGQNTVYLENQLRGFVQKTRVNDRMMHIGATGLTLPDIKAIAAYLATKS